MEWEKGDVVLRIDQLTSGVLKSPNNIMLLSVTSELR